jgi:hypothetical protein
MVGWPRGLKFKFERMLVMVNGLRGERMGVVVGAMRGLRLSALLNSTTQFGCYTAGTGTSPVFRANDNNGTREHDNIYTQED